MSNERKVALITGITGQDGSYLAELLLEKGYMVHGVMRRSSSFNTSRVEHLFRDPHCKGISFFLHYGDVSDGANMTALVAKTRPHEIYNLAAQSHVQVSFELPVYTAHVDALGTLNLLEAIRTCKLEEHTRLYQASTSELFGKVQEIPQSETTPFYPRSPYGVAKLYGFWIIKNYREAYGVFAVNGILFNHESPRRGATFVTRKITQGVAKVKQGKQDCIFLGNLDAKRDWGHAKDYVEMMWRMLQADLPSDYVAATGETHSVREFVELAFSRAGMPIRWTGCGLEETAVLVGDASRAVVRVDPKYFRPTEVDLLLGNPAKAKAELGWSPRVSFHELVNEMVDADLASEAR